jgi:carbon-monoxide dehydrogenase small subunit
MSSTALDISLTVNGERVGERVDARKTLVDFLREDLALTGSHVGCEHGVCGACTVRVDGAIVRGCLMLAVQCDGAKVETIEGLSDTGEIADLQTAFTQRNALQCGYCTPGMLVAAQDLLRRAAKSKRVPSRAAIREHLSGNTAAAPAITPSSMRLRRWRRQGREASDDLFRSSPRERGPRSL